MNVNVPVNGPDDVGVNVTLVEHVAVGANVPLHVEVSAKSPLAATLVMVKLTVPEFVSITVCALLVTLTITGPNDNCLVENEASGVPGATPVPVRSTVCGDGEALLVTLSVPGRDPVVVGVKVTEMVHEFPPAIAPVQVLVCA